MFKEIFSIKTLETWNRTSEHALDLGSPALLPEGCRPAGFPALNRSGKGVDYAAHSARLVPLAKTVNSPGPGVAIPDLAVTIEELGVNFISRAVYEAAQMLSSAVRARPKSLEDWNTSHGKGEKKMAC